MAVNKVLSSTSFYIEVEIGTDKTGLRFIKKLSQELRQLLSLKTS